MEHEKDGTGRGYPGIRQKGGVIGIEAAPNTTRSEAHLKHTIVDGFSSEYLINQIKEHFLRGKGSDSSPES